ncbi:MAG: alpha-mannosidase [Armatimonadota bacterium]
MEKHSPMTHEPAVDVRHQKDGRAVAVVPERRDARGQGEADINLITGESLIRYFLYHSHSREQAEFRLPDAAAGYPGALPQVLRGCGIRSFYTRKAFTGDLQRSSFWWEGIDGSRMLVHSLNADKPVTDSEPGALPTWAGELCFAPHRGAYTSEAVKQWEGHRCEFLLRDAEFLAAVQPRGADYPRAELNEAWELLLHDQFRTVVPEAMQESAHPYRRVREIGEATVAQTLGTFARLLDTGDLSHPVAVWNTVSFTRSGLASVPWKGKSDVNAFSPRGQASRTQLVQENGQRRLLVEVVDAPPMGYVIYDLRERAKVKASALAITDAAHTDCRVLENELVRVELNECGEIASFFDKQQEREIIAPGTVGNRFQRFDDRPDGWAGDPFDDEACEDLTAPATMEALENGPLRATVRVERQLLPGARLVQLIRLEANSRRLDFVTWLEWQEADSLLKVAFPVAIHSPQATYEIQFGHLDRPTHRNSFWDSARCEAPAHRWADLSESDYGVALLNDGLHGYDIHKNVLRLSLASAPNDADGGQHHFTYCLLPHRGEAECSGVPLAGYDLNVPFRAQLLPVQHGMLARAHSYFRIDKPNLVIEAVKRAEDGDGFIVRLFEAYRRRGTARLIVNGLCSRATRTDLLERNLDDLPVQGGAVVIEFRPFEIITLRLR